MLRTTIKCYCPNRWADVFFYTLEKTIIQMQNCSIGCGAEIQ